MNSYNNHLQTKINVTMVKYILSVDGGGIRGIIPALVLAEIEERTSKPISDIFDLVAGTSTGGIVAAGLCKKDDEGNPQFTARDLVELYQTQSSHIFSSSFFRKSVLSWLNCAQYPHQNLEEVLHKYFDEATLADASPNLLLTSYDIYNNCPFFLKSWNQKTSSIKMKDALRASTAAPTYFAPKYLKVNEIERVLVDGAILANNPAVCAYASGKELFPNDDVIVLSIGTGRTTKCINYSNSRSLGRIGWINPLVHYMFSSSIAAVNYQLEKVIGDKYIRIQSELQSATDALDDVNEGNISILQHEASFMLEENQEQLNKFCDCISLS